MLRRVIPIVLVLSACSGAGGSPVSPKAHACELVARLDAIAAGVRQLDVSDPAAFNAALRKAAKSYSDTIEELRPLVPADTQAGLDRLGADVRQLRFSDVATDREALDRYAADTCHRVAATTTSTTTAT